MSKSNRGKDQPHVRRIQRIEISDSNVKLRLTLIVVLLSITAVSLIVGVSSALQTEPGWQRVEVRSTKMNCGADFVLDYDFSADGSAATSRFKTLTSLYSAACENAFTIFSPDVPGDGIANVHDLNARPNETVTVDPVLYNALSLIQKHQNRSIYLGGIYAEYGRIFRAESEVEAASYDPVQDAQQREYIAEAAIFANDPGMIDVQLFSENQVMLKVSDEYLAFAETNEIENLIDFGWMKNAFIADFLAQVLTDNGFTDGYLASFDGFTRNLDTRGNTYSLNVFDRQGRDIYIPAVLTYSAPSSIVFLRDYPLGKSDEWHYYAFSNGRIANLLIDPADGMNKACVDSLVSYAKDQSCAELLLDVFPVYISDSFNTTQLQAMTSSGVYSIWCEGATVCYTDQQAAIVLSPQEDMVYTKVYAG